MTDKFENSDHAAALEHIAKEVATLCVPTLVPLQQTLLEMRASIANRRAALLLEAQSVRDEGFAAAARLSLLMSEGTPPEEPDYFAQVLKGGQS